MKKYPEILYRIFDKARKNRPDLIHEEVLDREIENREYYKVIFDINFAKAFWGEKTVSACCFEEINKDYFGQYCSKCRKHISATNPEAGESWKCHLQQMVITENPLKYLEKFLVK